MNYVNKKLLFVQKKVITVLVSLWGNNDKHRVSGHINWFILFGEQFETIYQNFAVPTL